MLLSLFLRGYFLHVKAIFGGFEKYTRYKRLMGEKYLKALSPEKKEEGKFAFALHEVVLEINPTRLK